MSNSLPQTLTGREMDQLIAEKVMGWGWMRAKLPQILPAHRWLAPPEQVGDWGHEFPADMSEPPEGGWWLLDTPKRGDHHIVPHYSTDISAAFQIVEKMHELIDTDDEWRRANLLTLSCRGKSAGWAAAFTCVHESDEWFEEPERFGGAQADTAPLAICRAALKALGIEVSS